MTNLNLLMRVGKTILSILILNVFGAVPVLAADNMRFHGALVAEPCTIRPGDDAISLNFGTVVDKYLYSNQRTPGKQFQIHLVDCDISLGTTASIIFLVMIVLIYPDYWQLTVVIWESPLVLKHWQESRCI